MGDVRILQEQIEIGVPLESAAILAGYSFEEIEKLEESDEVRMMMAVANATFISRHLLNVVDHSKENPRMSTWLLERLHPKHFSQTNKIIEVMIGIRPGNCESVSMNEFMKYWSIPQSL